MGGLFVIYGTAYPTVTVEPRAYAGKTLILYSDAPAPVPAGDPRQDPFTGGPDFSESGGSPTPLPGYGPNVRTIMQVKVAAATVAAPLAPLPSTYERDVSVALANSFRVSQPAPIVPESAYNPVYNPATPFNDTYLTIGAQNLTFTPVGESASMNVQLGSKALHELFTPTYGRMDSLLAVEIPNTNWLNQTTIPFFNFDPPTEYLPNDQIQLWKVTHNGVDTHTIHFHLFNVEIVNRVGWDGTASSRPARGSGATPASGAPCAARARRAPKSSSPAVSGAAATSEYGNAGRARPARRGQGAHRAVRVALALPGGGPPDHRLDRGRRPSHPGGEGRPPARGRRSCTNIKVLLMFVHGRSAGKSPGLESPLRDGGRPGGAVHDEAGGRGGLLAAAPRPPRPGRKVPPSSQGHLPARPLPRR